MGPNLKLIDSGGTRQVCREHRAAFAGKHCPKCAARIERWASREMRAAIDEARMFFDIPSWATPMLHYAIRCLRNEAMQPSGMVGGALAEPTGNTMDFRAAFGERHAAVRSIRRRIRERKAGARTA